jgi:hypothetical protein
MVRRVLNKDNQFSWGTRKLLIDRIAIVWIALV